MNKLPSEIENTILGTKGLLNFCDQYGKDVYVQILLEELLEGIMNEENVFVFGEQEQAGNETDHSPSGGESGGIEAQRPETT